MYKPDGLDRINDSAMTLANFGNGFSVGKLAKHRLVNAFKSKQSGSTNI